MTILKLKRGTTAQVAAVTPAEGELVADTSLGRLVIGDGSTTGGIALSTAASDKLTTPRSVRTNLASTSAVNFDGSAAITPGIQGILAAANGGTGVSTLVNLAAAMGMTGSSQNIQIPIAGVNYKIKMGNTVVTTNTSSEGTVAFASAFSTAVYVVIAVNGDDNTDSATGLIKLIGFTGTTLTGFNYHAVAKASSAVRITYIAIGV